MNITDMQLCVSWQVLEHWVSGGHRALVFTQTQQMLDILEKAVQARPGRPVPRP